MRAMNRDAIRLTVSENSTMKSIGGYGGRVFDRVLVAAAAVAVVITSLSFFGRAFWLLELLTHFRLHFAAGGAVLLLWAMTRRRLRVAMLAAVVTAANASPLVPYVVPGAVEAEAGQFHLRLMAANVSFRNSDYAALRGVIRQEEPDVIGLLEVNQTWLDELSPITSEYPYSIQMPEEGAYGLALFSRKPFHELTTSPYIENGLQTAIGVELVIDEVPFTLVLTHVRAPITPGMARLRNLQLANIANMLEAGPNEEQILTGDLNITPWSPYYLQLEAESDLVNAALGHGYRGTWPVGLSFLKIPIDHCLVSDGLRVRRFRTGADFGSDHLPIIVDIAAADPASAGITL